MTKAKALKQMSDYSRHLIDPEFARKIAKAFGYSFKDLGLKPRATADFTRSGYPMENAKLSSIATYQVAKAMAEKISGKTLTSQMNGMGSYCDDIVGQSIAILKQVK